jgi:hypothetical protein
MRRTLRLCELLTVLWSLSFCVVSTVLAANPADALPDSASAVLRWKSPQKSLTNLANYANAVQPGAGFAIQAAMPSLGPVIANPGLAGVDTEQDWWSVIFVKPAGIPVVVFLIPTTDMNALKTAMSPEVHLHAADKIAIYSDNEEALAKVRDQLSGKGKSLWSKVDASSKKLFDASDLSVLINVRQVAQDFKAELDQAESKLNEFLDQITTVIPDSQRAQIVPAFDVYRVLGKHVLQGVQDSNSLTLGITVTNDFVRYESRLQVETGTPTAKFLVSQTPSGLPLMSQLPTNKLSYFGLKVDVSGMIEWSMNLTRKIMKDMTEEQQTEFDAAVKKMQGLKYGEMAFFFDLVPVESGALRAGSVSEVGPTDEMRAISRRMMKAMGEIKSIGFTQTSKLEPAVEKIDGVEVDRITIEQKLDADADPLGMQKKFRDILFGESGMQQLVMYQPQRGLQTLGGGVTELQNLVTALAAKPSKDNAVTAARNRFVEKANVVGLVDVARLIVSGAKLASLHGAAPINTDALDDLKLAPSFLGGAIACEPTGIRSQFEIPVVQAQNIAKVVMEIVKSLQPPN